MKNKTLAAIALTIILSGFYWLSHDALETCLDKGYSVQQCEILTR